MLALSWGKRNTYSLPVLVKAGVEISMDILQMLEIDLPKDPAIPLLGQYSKDSTAYCRGISPFVSTFALFIVARNCKRPGCPSADEWIIKIIYIEKCYLFIRRNEIHK